MALISIQSAQERMDAEDGPSEGKFVVKYVEPYDDVIYFVKTVTVKEMSGPEDGFPYNSIIRETDLRELKETDLLDYEDDFQEANLTLYDFIDEESMNQLNKNKDMPYLPREKEAKADKLSDNRNMESSTLDIKELRSTDISKIAAIKETDLCSNDDDSSTDVEQRSQEESVSLSSGDTLGHNDEDSELWNLDNAESVSLSTDSGIINEDCSKLHLDLDYNHFNSAAIKFQDLESDFFDTDCEAMDKSPTDDCFETNRGETKDIVRFQDIESDFFETDCEGVDTNTNDNTVKFQDIESDFFDEDDEISPSSLALKNKTKTTVAGSSKKEPCEIDQQKQILTRLTSAKDKRATMTNSLLRTTIEELERALSNSNTLLIKRDKKIQDLRKHNNELKKSLSEELENSAQLKLLLLEKEAVVSEKEAKIASYQTECERLNQEITDLRLYQLNNMEDFSISCDPSNLDNSVETDLLGDQDITSSPNVKKKSLNRNQSSCSRQETPICKSKRMSSPDTTSQQKTSPFTTSTTPKSTIASNIKTRPGALSKSSPASPMSPQGGKVGNNPDNVSSTELHARLQMKFMRDAFFYYMIGFHSDEQINAILAILDYGDKRQDFVLEAHKLKKNGKKFNVSKVSTRGLTFVQDIQPK
ncbi:DNA ligase 1-like isoform X2 [Clytia hemisphaerica]|uniref:Uncharacterized protein n=1 Tax=Clytia hemisphaerica TaxID=252671 RepID=A0A7M5URI0_9CNID